MTMIIHRLSTSLKLREIIYNFYRRRFIRICPNYYFTLLYVIIIGRSMLRFSAFNPLRNESIWACFFAMNLKSIVERGFYFKLVSWTEISMSIVIVSDNLIRTLVTYMVLRSRDPILYICSISTIYPLHYSEENLLCCCPHYFIIFISDLLRYSYRRFLSSDLSFVAIPDRIIDILYIGK